MSTITAKHTVPPRSLQQMKEALALAQEIRLKRVALKRDIRGRRKSFAVVLADPPEWLLSAYVIDVLLAVPKVGRVKAEELFRRNGISLSKTFRGITARQRKAIADELEAFERRINRRVRK